MSMTTELVVAGGTAIAGGALTPLLGKKAPHWRLREIFGPQHQGYWNYDVTYKVQRKLFGLWFTVRRSKIKTDRGPTFDRSRAAVFTYLQGKLYDEFRDSTIVWDSQLDDVERLTQLKKKRT